MSIEFKKPFSVGLNAFVQQKNQDAVKISRQALPATVVSVNLPFVTVAIQLRTNFTIPQVTCAVVESKYVRVPIQVGDSGLILSADSILTGVTGQSNSVSMQFPSNLESMIFLPLGSKSWNSVDANAVYIQDSSGASVIQVKNDKVLLTSQAFDVITLEEVSVSAGASISLTAVGSLDLSGEASASLSSLGSTSVSGSTTTVSGNGLATVSAPVVMLGQAAAGNLSNLPNGAGSLYNSTVGLP